MYFLEGPMLPGLTQDPLFYCNFAPSFGVLGFSVLLLRVHHNRTYVSTF